MSNIVKFQFDGDTLDVVQDGERLALSLKRACEALGVAFPAQFTKLKNLDWATVTMIETVGEDGKLREMACLDVDLFHGWLFTIHPNKVRPELREKLQRYQRECVKVLRDHFMGKPAEAAPALDLRNLAQLMTQAMAPIVQLMSDRLTKLEERAGGGAIIDDRESAWIKREVSDIAKLRRRFYLCKSVASARRWAYNKLGAAVQWSGAGRAWNGLPSHRFADARVCLAEMRRETEDSVESILSGKQLGLFGSVSGLEKKN